MISLSLARMPDSFLMFVFVTCICFALVAWSGLFINRNVAPARVAIAVIPVLIMLNLEPLGMNVEPSFWLINKAVRNSVISNLPPLNYLTWITSYLLLMKFFCLSAVFEHLRLIGVHEVSPSRLEMGLGSALKAHKLQYRL